MASKAELVKQLRAITFAGMTDCMKALNETNDNLDLAVEWLRKNGAIKAAKKAGAIAAEGLTLAKFNNNKTSSCVIEVNCQTDFVAKNEQFVKLTNDMLNAILESNSTNVENLKINGKTFEEASQELTAIIGEKIGFRRAEILTANANQTIGIYTHMNNRVATSILVEGKVSDEVVTNVAMHIAAMNPKYVNESEVDQNWLNKEKEIIFEQTKQESNKPAEFLGKIVDGRVNKLLKEICLVSQPYVKDPSMTVEQYLASNNAKAIKMINFVLGDGIEKKESDFAAEVAEQMSQANK
ncbi:MAG: translation elongation factor Ts [Ureaplasma sp.]|nr:translation elongation factor Ts [Ureaplasma sp.]